MQNTRSRQLEYSEIQHLMFDEDGRRRKASKILAVLLHFLGREDLEGLRLLDVGSSSGIVASEFARHGATVTGVDIDVSGTQNASENFGEEAGFLLGDSERLPFTDDTFDLVVCNHIYEHVIDDVALLAELRRVLSPSGAMYLGLGNRLGVVEPHYKLPFLSWLPHAASDRYVQLARKGDAYHERFRTWLGLQKLCADLEVWDYTAAVMAEPERLAPGEAVPGILTRLPGSAIRALYPIVPTYLWVATKEPIPPAGPELRVPPRRVNTSH